MPDRTVVRTQDAPAAIGPYSQAIVAGGTVFASGQIPLDPATMQVVSGGIAEQTEQVCRNIAAVLAAAGSRMESIVKTTVFMTNLGDFAAMNEVYARHIAPEGSTNPAPARSTVQVAALPRGVAVEIECIALVG